MSCMMGTIVDDTKNIVHGLSARFHFHSNGLRGLSTEIGHMSVIRVCPGVVVMASAVTPIVNWTTLPSYLHLHVVIALSLAAIARLAVTRREQQRLDQPARIDRPKQQ